MWKYELDKNDLLNLDLNIKNDSNILNQKDLDYSALLNNLIIESQYSVEKHKWQPIRIRYDKQYPNNYNVGLTNVSLIFDPPHYEQPYFKTEQNLDSTDIKLEKRLIPKNIETLIRTYIWDYITINNENYLPFSNEPIVLIDYMCDSSDIINYYTSNIVKIFAVSDSRTKLVNYTNALKDSYLNSNSHKHIITILNQITHPRIYLNVFDKCDFNKNIIKSNDFVLSEINTIFINNLNNINLIQYAEQNENTNFFELNINLDELINSNIKEYCNIDTVVIYVYLGNDFNKFFKKYSSKIIHCFNPLINEDFINYLLNSGISKMEIDKYSYLINCAILKL
jgi:hypothetical protein